MKFSVPNGTTTRLMNRKRPGSEATIAGIFGAKVDFAGAPRYFSGSRLRPHRLVA
jgi:hypothetical protein